MTTFQDFLNLDIRVGTIIAVDDFKEAKKPAYKLTINFGDVIGIKKSSAQITTLYRPDELLHKQIIAVVNFPTKQIGPFFSECLVLGIYQDSSNVVLLQPERRVENGTKIG